MAKIVSDPLGNEIIIPQGLLDFNKHVSQSEDILDDMSKVIERPIMLFRTNEKKIKFYYLRAVGWNKTMLLEVQKNGAHFKVIHYEMDPSIEKLTGLHTNYERLI